MKSKKIIAGLIVIMMLAVLFAACDNAQPAKTEDVKSDDSADTSEPAPAGEEPDEPEQPAEKLKIGLSLFGLTSEYLANLKDNMACSPGSARPDRQC